MMSPSIVVTGAAGMIGSVLVYGLNKMGITDIMLVDNLGKGEKWKNLYGLRFLEIISPEEFLGLITGRDEKLNDVSAVFHLGACSSTTEKDADYLINNNVRYSQKLAIWAVGRHIRFIFASSAATYGKGENGFVDDEGKLNTLRPLNIYGFSKHLFDLWAQKTGLLPKIASLKYFNVFGPNEYHKGPMRSMALKAFEQISATGEAALFRSYLTEYKDGEQERDFIYVKDAVDATLFFLENEQANGIFNIGTGKARTWNDLMKAIFSALKKPVKINYIDMPEDIKGQYQYHTRADISKLRDAGYKKPFSELEDAVYDYVANYLVGHKFIGEAENP